jgi:NADH-quinone oxidoreductase subunit F
MVQILDRLEAGQGSEGDIELLQDVGSRILGKSLCALGDFAVYPVASYIAKWGDEFRQHVELGRCPFEGASSIEGIVAPSDVNAHAPQKVFA